MIARLSSLGCTLVLGGLLVLSGGCSDDPLVTRPAPGAAAAATAVADPAVRSVSLEPATVTAGDSVTGTVVLAAPAPAGGTVVGIMSNNTAVATVEPGATVPAGDTLATFRIATKPVATLQSAAISANAGQVTVTTTLWVEPAGLAVSSLTFPGLLVKGGTTATGTVTLNGSAPAGGTTVALSSSDTAAASVPASVTVPEGAATATFPLTAGTVASLTTVYVSAAFGGVTRTARLLVDVPAPTGPVPTSVVVDPHDMVGGTPAQGTVTLASAASSDVQVALSSVNTGVATVPPSVTVPAGATSAVFPVTTLPTTEANFSVIYAEANGVRVSTTVNVVPVRPALEITSLAFAPPRIGGGGPLTGLVTFGGPAVENSVSAGVFVTSSRPDIVQVPSGQVFEIFVSGTKTLAFPITTRPVGSNVEVTITATVPGSVAGEPDVVRSAVLTVTTDPPPPPDVVRIVKATFKPRGKGYSINIQASSTVPTAILNVFASGDFSHPYLKLVNMGRGQYEVNFNTDGGVPANITVLSNLGGSASGKMQRK